MPKNIKLSERTTSRSQILDYKNCGYRWDLGYNRGIAATRLSEKMDMGSAVHMGIKYAVHHYASAPPKRTTTARWPSQFASVQKGVAAWAKETRERLSEYLTDQHEEEIKVISNDAVGIALKALESINLPDWEVALWQGKPVCEMEFITPLAPWKGYRTIPDLVARERCDGKKAPYWLIDWKTRGSFESDEAEEINLQFATMQYVMFRETNIRIEGSLLWQVKAQVPRRPEQNKDGKMSRAAIVTDWPTYSAALVDAGLNPIDYVDMKEKIGLVEWFRTIKQHRSMGECISTWEQIVEPTARRMATDPDVTRRFTHQPFACSGCWARAFCLTELRGEDTEFLLETDYMDTRRPRAVRPMGDARRKFNLEGE